ncbi:MAG: S1 RNA-binding domain-containing protein, partial [Microvirga sp.]
GQTVKVKIIKINHETHRISLGIKQLLADPWEGIAARYPVNAKLKGRVTNITDYGAFVELEPGIEGLIHVSEMSWTKKNVHPGKIVSTSQEVEVQVLEVDPVKRRISLGLKQTLQNPWEAFAEKHPVGSEIEGEVKNKTEFGLFIGLEGDVDGMVHLSDLDWNRPGEQMIEEFKKGDVVRAQVLDVDVEKERISLGIKQLLADPWEGIAARYPVNAKLKGRVTNITDYGAFVELEPGIEGLIHVSEMSWTKKNVHPGKIVSTSQEVEVQILEVDPVKRRISLGLKQTLQNPWEAFAEKHPVGSEIEGEVKNKTEFGLFIGLEGDVDGMVHLSDLDWNRPGEQMIEEFKKGDVVRAQVLDVDVEKERISLGIKQLAGDPFADAGEIKKGQVVTCEVLEVKDSGLEVKIVDTDLSTFIRRAELARDRADQRPERFAAGERVDARVTQFDRKARRVTLSIKALEVAEEKEAMAQYGSADSGASLGDILGAALNKAKTPEKK